MKYADSENMKADRVNTVVFKLNQIKRRVFFFCDIPGISFESLRSGDKYFIICFGEIFQFRRNEGNNIFHEILKSSLKLQNLNILQNKLFILFARL